MNDVKQVFVDAFRHVAGNRPCPKSKYGSIRMRSSSQDQITFGRVYVRLSDILKTVTAVSLLCARCLWLLPGL